MTADLSRPTAMGVILRELRSRRDLSRAELNARTEGAIAPSAVAGMKAGYRAIKVDLLATEALVVRVHAAIA